MKSPSALLLLASLLAPASLLADAPDWSAFAKSVNITFPGAPASELANFPVLVRVSAANGFDYSKFQSPSDGGDLRFSDADGNPIPHEIDTWNQGGESLVWVKVPRLTAATNIVAHYGCASPAAVTASDVWSEGYAAVWHMNAASGSTEQANSTANNLTLGLNADYADSVEADVPGAVGTAAAFDRRADHKGGYRVGDWYQKLHGLSAATWEVWSKQTALPSYNAYIFRMYASAGDAYKIYEYATNGRLVAYPKVSSAADGAESEVTYWPGLFPVVDQWNHIVWRYDGDAGTKAVILNGDISGKYSGTATKGAILTLPNGGYLIVGNFTDSMNANAFPGSLDEIRISNVARSDAWVKATHDTIADAAFCAYEPIAKGGNDLGKYARKFTVTFPGVGGGVTLTDFPALVKISASSPAGFSYADCARADGGDLRFADEAGNLLPSEVDTWNPDGESFVWVKVPTLTATTKITGYYGWAEAPAVVSSDVWTNGYVGVWHLGEGALPLQDSTANGNDFTSAKGKWNTTDYATDAHFATNGVAGKAVDFTNGNKSGGFWADADPSLDVSGTFTVECWTYQEEHLSSSRFILAKRDTYNSDIAWYLYDNGQNGTTVFQAAPDGSDGTSASIWISTATVPAVNVWNHQAVSYNAGTPYAASYLNGVASREYTTLSSPIRASAAKLCLGNQYVSSTSAFPGSIDEVRISNVARSAAWVKATHDTIADNASFMRYGAARDNVHAVVVIFR